MKDLDAFRKKEIRALSKFISRAENRDDSLLEVLEGLYGETGKAKVIGITGPPGAGKSTLVSSFIKIIRAAGKSVAVIAVDPVSPYSGGALLGDRIRLQDHFNDDQVYIRSLSTRGKLGGLSLASREVVQLTDAFGFDYVLIETVGVGQSEVDVKNLVQATLVVLVPESGDSIQTLKAGILEIGDLLVVNKSDRPGADIVETDLRTMLEFSGKNDTPVCRTTQNDPGSVQKLFEATEQFLKKNQSALKAKRDQAAKATFEDLLRQYVADEVGRWVNKQTGPTANPYGELQKFRKKYPPGALFPK